MQRLLPCRPPGAATLGILLLAGALPLVAAAALHASNCTGCPPPSMATLQAQPGFTLAVRTSPSDPDEVATDQVHLDAGECVTELAGPPNVVRIASWLALRGEGEVWHCPHSRSQDTITVQAAASDSTSWELSGSIGFKLGDVAEAITAELSRGNTTGTTITEVTSVSKTIVPGYCHRIRWAGYFEVATFKATAEVKFSQRWAWWTKNATTGSTVHAKGDVWVSCGTGTVELGRMAPIAGYFSLSQRGCTDGACIGVVPKHLGFFPELPPHLGGSSADEPEPPTTGTASDPATEGPDVPDSGGLDDPPTGPLPDPLATEEER
jgi:hypothetical protein